MAGLGGFVCVKASAHICVRVFVCLCVRMQCQLFPACVLLYVLIKYEMQKALPKGKWIWDSSNANISLSHAKDQNDTVKFSLHW